MASFEVIKGSPIAALMHDLREREHYNNPDIDHERTCKNYILSSNGNTVKDCMKYYEHLLEGVYHRGKGTITTAQWVVTSPVDLPPEREREFFEHTYDFLNDYYYDGDPSRCLLATVHYDEAGKAHMHYIMIMPDVDNPKYISLETKLISGLEQTQKHFDVRITKEQAEDILRIVKEYDRSALQSRDRYAIRDIQEVLGLVRDDARWVLSRVTRRESEKYKKKLQSKSNFLTKQSFDDFHPALKQWMLDAGIDCTVYKGGMGINFTVEQLKSMTKETGLRLVDSAEYEHLHDKVSELERKLRETERSQAWGSGWKEEQTWGRD